MSKIFKVSVNNSINFEITSDVISELDAFLVSESEYHILQENKPYKAQITKANFNKKEYKVIVNKNTYNINIYNALDTLINDMGFSLGTTKYIHEIKAPMPGLILQINIEVEQEVNENDTLLILEAMKMENNITSPRDGIIKSIYVKKGQAVEKNQLLIEFKD